jgi:hypothetical protein
MLQKELVLVLVLVLVCHMLEVVCSLCDDDECNLYHQQPIPFLSKKVHAY